MTETARDLQTLLNVLFADGQVEDVSARDARDAIVSLVSPRGGFYVADGDDLETEIASVDEWTRIAGNTTERPHHRSFEMVGANSLEYQGGVVRPVTVVGTLGIRALQNNIAATLALAVNGVPVEQRTRQVVEFGDLGVPIHVTVPGILELTPGDEIGLFIKNTTDSSNFRAVTMHLSAFGHLT